MLKQSLRDGADRVSATNPATISAIKFEVCRCPVFCRWGTGREQPPENECEGIAQRIVAKTKLLNGDMK